MNTSALIIGDVHIKVNNITEIDILIKNVCDVATNKKPDFIVLLGDILDTFEKINTFELNKAYELIDNLRNISKTYVLIGNHDMVNCVQYLTINHWANGIKKWDNVIVIDKTYEENDFIFVPYVPNGRFIDALNELNEEYDWTKARCIFAHQEFYGAKMGAIISEDGDKWLLEYPNVISGHLHMNQNPQHNIYYPGSSMQVAYGETQDNIVAFCSFNKDNYDLEEIPLGLSKKKIIYTTLDNIEEIPETNDKIKLSISGDYEEFKVFKKSKKYKQMTSKGIKIVFKQTKKEIKSRNEKINENIGSNNFREILNNLIKDVDNKHMRKTYELVINNKHIDNDVIYV